MSHSYQAVCRVETRKRIRGALLAHVDGRNRPKPRKGFPEGADTVKAILPEGADPAELAARAVETYRTLHPPKSNGRPPLPAVEFLLGGPPPWDSPDAWTLDQVHAWAYAAVAWARRVLGPSSIIYAAYIHYDETSPHVHVLATPLVRDGSRVGWNARMREAVEEGLAPKGAKRYTRLQSWYAAEMEPWGLERGTVGSTRKHERPDPAKDGRGERWAREEAERAAPAPAATPEPEEVFDDAPAPAPVGISDPSLLHAPFADPGPDLDPDDLPPPAPVVEVDAPETAAPEGGSGIPDFSRHLHPSDPDYLEERLRRDRHVRIHGHPEGDDGWGPRG